jgi:hypothetical protein
MEKEPILDSPKFHEIWVKQCEAAEHVKLRYGSKAAFDYIVAEKLFTFADVAATHPEFARELPRFVARVRALFTVEEMQAHLHRIELEQRNMTPSTGTTSSMNRMSSWRRMRSASKALRPPRSVLGNSP